MNLVLGPYFPLLVFIFLSFVICFLFILVPFIVSPRKPDSEKNSSYECGFDPFDDARMKFDIRFYLVAILFIVLDLEMVFLFPWSISFHNIGTFGFFSMLVFLILLAIGFCYEWKKGALEWY